MTAAVTIHFKKPELTRTCIESLLTDGWTPILVWDNSDDGGTSLQVLQAHFATDERLKWVVSPANIGFSKGMNGALAALASYGYQGPILLINNDTRVNPGLLTALTNELTSLPFPTLIAPRIIQGGEEHGWLYYHPWLALVTRRPLPGSFSYLSGCCLFVNRSDNSQPLFDEDFFMYGEDVELSWRIRRQGGHLELLSQAWLHHEGSASSGQASESYERFLVQSHILLANKLGLNVISKVLMRLSYIVSLIGRACIRSIRFRSHIPLKALLRRH